MTAAGEIARQCTAHSSRTGLQCRRSAILGGTVCPSHGGGAPQVKRAASRRLHEQRVQHELGALLASLEDETAAAFADPIEVLVTSVHRAAAMRDVLGLVVAKLGEDNLTAYDHLDDLRPHPTVTQYREWTVEAARLSKLALDAGVEARRLELDKRDGERLAAVLVYMIDTLRGRLLDVIGQSDSGVVTAGTVRSMFPQSVFGGLAREAIEAVVKPVPEVEG